MSSSPLRFVAVAGVAALTFAAPATAFAAGHSHATKPSHSSHKHHGKPARARFTAVGTIVSVDTTAGTVTINDNGGSKDLHGNTAVVVTVSSTTKITLDDASVTLDKLQPGDHVMANGTRANGALNAAHVNASSPPEPDASDSPSPDPSQSTAATTG